MLCDLDLVPSMIQDLLPWIYLGRAHLCYVCMVQAGALNMLILCSSIYVRRNGFKDHEIYTCFSDTCFQNHIAYTLWSCCDDAMIYDMPWLDMTMICAMLCFKGWDAMIRYDYVIFHAML